MAFDLFQGVGERVLGAVGAGGVEFGGDLFAELVEDLDVVGVAEEGLEAGVDGGQAAGEVL